LLRVDRPVPAEVPTQVRGDHLVRRVEDELRDTLVVGANPCVENGVEQRPQESTGRGHLRVGLLVRADAKRLAERLKKEPAHLVFGATDRRLVDGARQHLLCTSEPLGSVVAEKRRDPFVHRNVAVDPHVVVAHSEPRVVGDERTERRAVREELAKKRDGDALAVEVAP